MIARVRGTLVSKDLDSVEVMTEGGVAYELTIPLNVFEALPRGRKNSNSGCHETFPTGCGSLLSANTPISRIIPCRTQNWRISAMSNLSVT